MYNALESMHAWATWTLSFTGRTKFEKNLDAIAFPAESAEFFREAISRPCDRAAVAITPK